MKNLFVLIAFLTCAAMLGGCGGETTETPVGETTAGPPQPSELIFLFQRQADPSRIRADAEQVAQYLSEEIGIPVRHEVPGEYAASVQAIVNKKADFAYVSALPFLLARRDGNASIVVVEQRPDVEGNLRTEYDSIFVVPADSPYQSLEEIVENASNLTICFTSRTSTSGYIMAYSRLVEEGLLLPGQKPEDVFKEVLWGNGYSQALEQVASGRADICAVSHYTMEGDSADRYLPAETRQQLRILARTPGVPTHLVCARDGLSDDLKQKVASALLKLGEEHPELLRNVYGASVFVETDEDQHVQGVVEAVERLQLPVHDLAR